MKSLLSQNRLLIILFLIPCTGFMSSCVQEGCTDEKALNYDESADDDNGSCVYKDSLRNDYKKEERSVITFELDWDGSNEYEAYAFNESLEGKSVLLYMKHPDWANEWTAMPFTHEGVSYYYTEHTGNKKIFVYGEDVSTGNLAITSGTTTEHKAVVVTNEFLKKNPDAKDLPYEEIKEKVLQ
ncbi:MAG: hypothetical protein ABEH38_07515 [Flavobacteriales bacterium]